VEGGTSRLSKAATRPGSDEYTLKPFGPVDAELLAILEDTRGVATGRRPWS